jgi:hypothetical protein
MVKLRKTDGNSEASKPLRAGNSAASAQVSNTLSAWTMAVSSSALASLVRTMPRWWRRTRSDSTGPTASADFQVPPQRLAARLYILANKAPMPNATNGITMKASTCIAVIPSAPREP